MPNNPRVVLDFGCGDGRIIKEMLAINPKSKYIGLDVSDIALKAARAFCPEAEFYKIHDGGTFPLSDSTVNFIFSSEVIEHVYDTKNAFTEMHRVLVPQGKLLLTTPYHGLIKNILIALMNFENHFDPCGPHVRFFTKKSLFSCLTSSGFCLLKHGYFGRFFPVPHCIFVLAEKK